MLLSNIISSCSGVAIQDAFERLVKNQIPNKNLIGPRNYFLRNTKDKVDDLNKRTNTGGIISFINPLTSKKRKHIEEYISSSVLVHNSDGWNYLSRSIDSLINGDISCSIHLAYYAELRAVMSLMAYEGIGIFNTQHIWFDSAKNATLFKGYTTHKLVDESIEIWANQTTKKNILFDLVRIKNNSLSDWIRETGFSSRSKYARSIANTWLKKWSIDLHLKEDQLLRNEMSYRPHYDIKNVEINLSLEKLSEIWELLEPTNANSFPLLDQHLLRIALEEIYTKSKGRRPSRIEYENYLKDIFRRIGESPTQSLFGFLIRDTSPNDPMIINEAKKDNLNFKVNKKDPFPLICRAIMLLRLSTGGAKNLIERSTLDKDDLVFWSDRICYNSGISDANPSLIDPIDLFADVRDSINDLRSNFKTLNCVREPFLLYPEAMFNIKQFQRAGIWGIMA